MTWRSAPAPSIRTTLRALWAQALDAAYVHPSRRPKDGRYGENPNSPAALLSVPVIPQAVARGHQELISSRTIGIDPKLHDIGSSRTIGNRPRRRLGPRLEMLVRRMEVSQFTYFQQVAGLNARRSRGELNLRLERLAMYVQGRRPRVFDLNFNGRDGARKVNLRRCLPGKPRRNIRGTFRTCRHRHAVQQFKMAEAACANTSRPAGRHQATPKANC